MTNEWPPTLGFVVWSFVGHWSLVISVFANAQRPTPNADKQQQSDNIAKTIGQNRPFSAIRVRTAPYFVTLCRSMSLSFGTPFAPSERETGT
jgi:hypothetical protein